MKYDAVIFDLDGTLWDATEASTSGWNKALRLLGSDRIISNVEMESVTGKPIEECIKILLLEEDNQYSNLFETISQYEKEEIFESGGVIFTDCIKTIKSLHNQYKLFIASNCQEWYLDSFFNHSGCKKYFLDYNCHGMSGLNKTAMLQEFKDKYDLKNPVYIGDTEPDKTAAEQAGYNFIFANYGFGDLPDPTDKIDSIADLKIIL